jgi:cold shock CspA family protein
MQGIVKRWRPEAYGFIETEAGDFFFHASQALGPIALGDTVEFWLEDSPVRIGELVAVEVCKAERVYQKA